MEIWCQPPTRRSRLASKRSARCRCLVGVACALLLAGSAVAPQSALASTPQPITAQLQQPGGESSRDLFHVDGRAVHSTPGYFYVQGQATTRAYTLDPRRPLPTSSTTWHAVPLSTGGLHGLAAALWTMNARLPGTPLPGDLEGAARQIAIWAKGGGLSIDAAMVPNPLLRRRALLLTRAAPDNYSTNPQPTKLALSAFVQHASGANVEVLVNVADEMEDTFDQPQRIDLRVDGRWTTIKTHSRFDVNPAQGGNALASHRSGLAPDNNTAIARIVHVTGVTQLELFWNVDLRAGVAMMPYGNAPAIVTANPIKVGLSDVLDAGTATPGTGSSASWLLGLGAGWISALLTAFGLWLNGRRRPTLRAAWNTYDDHIEVADVTVVAGRRPIEIRELGLVFSWGAPWRRQRHYLQGAIRRSLPVLLQDGASVETSFELSHTIDRLHLEIGDPAREIAVVRPYVHASGKVFRGRSLARTPWARLRQFVRSTRLDTDGPSQPSVVAGDDRDG